MTRLIQQLSGKRWLKYLLGLAVVWAVFQFSSNQASAQVTLSLSPASGGTSVGATFTANVLLSTGSTQIDGVDIFSLNFNPAILQVVDANSGTSGVQITPGTSLPLTLINTVNNSTGTIQFSQTTSGGSTFSGSGTVATITFQGAAAGTSAVTFDFTPGNTSDTNVASAGSDLLNSVTNGSYTITSADTTPPTVSMTAPSNGATVSGTSTTVSATANDNNGVAGVQFLLNGSNLGSEDTSAPYSITWDTTTSANGSQTLTARARDTSNNLTTSSGITVTVSNLPTVTISVTDSAAGEPSDSGTFNISRTGATTSSLTVNYTISGTATNGSDYSTITSSVNIPSGSSSSNITVSPIDDTSVEGAETVILTISSNASYTIGGANSATITLTDNDSSDTTPPSGSVTSPANGATVSGSSVTVSATATDNIGVVGVQFLLGGANLGSEDTTAPYSITWNTTTASNGAHTITARIRDAAGNQTTTSGVNVTVNNTVTPPPPPAQPTPPPPAQPTPPPPAQPTPPPPAQPTPPPPGTSPTPDRYPAGLIFKYSASPTVYIKEGTVARPITDWTVYLNNVPPTRKIVTIPSTVTFPQGSFLGLRSGTLIRSASSPTVFLTVGNSKRPFSSESEFYNNSYNFNQVYTINDPNLVNNYPTITTAFVRPFGTLFKYSTNPTVYFLNSARLKRPFTTYNMFRLWVDDPKNVITIPTSESYSDGPIVTLPNGILVKGSGPTVYLTDQDRLRPFTSQTGFETLGFTFADVITIADSDIALHQIGENY